MIDVNITAQGNLIDVDVITSAPVLIEVDVITGIKGDTGTQGLTGPIGLQGSMGVQGIQGVPGATGGVYQHTQSVSATIWAIPHNLGYYPNVTVIDSSGNRIFSDIIYNSTNQITLTHSAAFSGVAYLT